MKSVSTAFKIEQAKPACVSLRRVSYKRRYWVQGTQSYTWEASWTALSEAEVISVSPITAKLDTDAVNEFKISNVTLNLLNADRRWTPTNPYGRFGKDSGSTLYGYEPYWTKFRIETGYTVGGVDTYTPLFVGVAVEFQTDAYSDSCQISVQGLEALLQNANAENVSTLVENETPTGTVNGTNKDFVTVQPGAGIIIKVTIDGVEKKAGTDYNISDLDTPTLGAKITFAAAPTGGQVVKVWYRYWQQNKSIKELVESLAIEAGIDPGSMNVEPIVFPGGVANTLTRTTQTDWEAGTNQTINTTSVSGSMYIEEKDPTQKILFDDFSDGDYTANPTWSTSGYFGCPVAVSSGKLKIGPSTGGGVSMNMTASTPFSRGVGFWQMDFRVNSLDDAYAYQSFTEMNFIDNGGLYKHKARVMSSGGRFIFSVSYPTAYGITGIISADVGPEDQVTHTIGIGMDSNHNVTAYYDGSYIGTGNASSASYFTGSYFSVYVKGGEDGFRIPQQRYWEFDNIYVPVTNCIGTYTSEQIDLGSGTSAYGAFSVISDLNGGTIAKESRTSVDGISWDSWVAFSPSGGILSTPKRYIQFRFYFTETTAGPSPIVHHFTLEYFNTTLGIALASFTGKTVYDAIQSLGSFANYEWGFKEDETFFFRSKEVSPTLDETLDTSTNLIDVNAINNGYDRVYHEVQSEFGSFKVTVSKTKESNDSPLSRFGKRRFSVSNSDILLAADVNVADGVAKNLLDYLSIPRRTCKAKTKLMEWLDLSDTVLVNFRDNPNTWWLGDSHVYLGQADVWLHGPEANTLDGFLAKVVGYRHDTENKMSEFDLEEIVA